MASPNVNFEISYAGSYVYQGGGEISVIDVQFAEANQEICVDINRQFTVSKEQILNFRMRSATGNSLMDTQSKWTSVRRISLPTELAKTIQLSARIFQSYENSNVRTVYPEGTTRGELRARRYDLSISTPPSPEFVGGNCYRIKVVNENNRLSATFVPIDEATAQAERQEQMRVQMEAAMRLVNQGMANIHLGLRDVPGKDQALQGLQNMVQTYQQGNESEAELDALEITQLQVLYEAAEKELQEARTKFNSALLSKNQLVINQALSEKQAISTKVIKLAMALERKGASPTSPSINNPQCQTH